MSLSLTRTRFRNQPRVEKKIETLNPLETMYINQENGFNEIIKNAELNNKIVFLEQYHFNKGTVIIAPDYYLVHDINGNVEKNIINTSGYVFKLKENISFNPNAVINIKTASSDDVWKSNDPISQQFSYYDPAAYGIGFFAAIALSATNVVLDLNNFTLEQNISHYVNMRFYANIEIGDRPFIPKQGPHNFGPSITSANNCCIMNGHLGRSSHHGIHGNNANNILLKNLSFTNYEIATIHLNGSTNISLKEISGLRSCDSCPILGIFSAGRFLRRYLDTLVSEDNTGSLNINGSPKSYLSIRDELKESLYNSWKDILDNGYINKEKNPNEWSLFNNESRKVDGVNYGLVFNKKGLATNAFPSDRLTFSENIYMKNVVINNAVSDIREVPTLKVLNNDGEIIGPSTNDSIGAVFQSQNIDADGNLITINSDGSYKGNVVSNAQLAITNYLLLGNSLPNLDTSRNNISQHLLDFAKGDKTLHSVLNSGLSLGTYTYNGDSMFHVIKPSLGFKLDAIVNIYLDNCSIYNLKNFGKIGLTPKTLPISISTTYNYDNYITNTGLGHPGGLLKQYSGADLYGISIFSSKDVSLRGIIINNIESENGECKGIRIDEISSAISLNDIRITGINSSINKNILDYENNPTQKPKSTGIYVGEKVNNVNYNNITIDQLYGLAGENRYYIHNF